MAGETTTLPSDPPTDPPTTTPDPVAAPAEEPKPEATPAPEGEEPKPEGEEPTSAFDKLIEGLTDPDEIEAAIERAREKLPEDRRQPKVEAKAEAEAVVLAEQRRREQVRQNESKRDGAVSRLNGHLREVKTKLASDDPGNADYDGDLLTTAINEIVQAEIALADNSARDLFSTALTHRIEKHGGALSDERFKQIVKDVAENKVEHGIVGGYLDEYGQRRYAEGLAEGEAKAQVKDAGWRKAETAAVRAELMRERDGEPDPGTARPPIGDIHSIKTPQDWIALSPEERERVLATSGR